MKMMRRFDSKVVIVTGAASGIGAATAKRFLDDGASVVLNDIRRDKLVETSLRFDPGRVLIHNGDVSDRQYLQAMVDETISRFDRIDVLVNNAGIEILGPILETPIEGWHKIMQTNVDSVYFAVRAALPHLLKSKGSIINVSSTSGLGGDWYNSAYNASKGAVSNLTRALALELGIRGVRVNAVAPGMTFTEMTKPLEQHAALMDKFLERIPLGRGATPEEVASVIAFLASEDAAFVNGVNLPVDGGLTASNGQPNATLFLTDFGFTRPIVSVLP
jgi:meso-butanediol dehydrogenase / (S,S)-butanediol dehydrogenase / diacetyl reductase